MNAIATLAPAGTWQLDPIHSSVEFGVAYLSGSFKGQLREVAATLTSDGAEASLEGAAKVASIDVKDENLAAHLQSPDFFDAEQFPELRFSATAIAPDGAAVAARGELTIKGRARPVEIEGSLAPPLTDAYGNERIGLALSATVDRTDFGVDWNNPLPNGEAALANTVTIHAELFFVKAA
jgi:polyisoprenoid-binding protein YceI